MSQKSKYDVKRFVELWNVQGIDAVIKEFNVTRSAAKKKAHLLRKQGYPLVKYKGIKFGYIRSRDVDIKKEIGNKKLSEINNLNHEELISYLEERKKEFVTFKTLWEQKKKERNEVENMFQNYTGWVYFMADLHIPYTRYDLLFDELVKIAKNKSPKILILGGDTLNVDLFSRFINANELVSLPSEEIETAQKMLNILGKIFDNVIFIKGNHEVRIEKFLLRIIPGITEQKETLALCKTFRELFEMVDNCTVIEDFFIRIGDAVFVHPEGGSLAIEGRTGVWVVDAFCQRMDGLRVVFTSHTHKQSKLWRKKILSIESGYLSKIFDYTRSPKSFIRVGKYGVCHLGYALGYFEKGKVNINSCDFVNLGFEEEL